MHDAYVCMVQIYYKSMCAHTSTCYSTPSTFLLLVCSWNRYSQWKICKLLPLTCVITCQMPMDTPPPGSVHIPLELWNTCTDVMLLSRMMPAFWFMLDWLCWIPTFQWHFLTLWPRGPQQKKKEAKTNNHKVKTHDFLENLLLMGTSIYITNFQDGGVPLLFSGKVVTCHFHFALSKRRPLGCRQHGPRQREPFGLQTNWYHEPRWMRSRHLRAMGALSRWPWRLLCMSLMLLTVWSARAKWMQN